MNKAWFYDVTVHHPEDGITGADRCLHIVASSVEEATRRALRIVRSSEGKEIWGRDDLGTSGYEVTNVRLVGRIY